MICNRVGAGLAKWGVFVAVLLIIANCQLMPARLGDGTATAAAGGCGSGMCTGETATPCSYMGDACGYYELCDSDPDGLYICNPGNYCTAAGCTIVHGGSCY